MRVLFLAVAGLAIATGCSAQDAASNDRHPMLTFNRLCQVAPSAILRNEEYSWKDRRQIGRGAVLQYATAMADNMDLDYEGTRACYRQITAAMRAEGMLDSIAREMEAILRAGDNPMGMERFTGDMVYHAEVAEPQT